MDFMTTNVAEVFHSGHCRPVTLSRCSISRFPDASSTSRAVCLCLAWVCPAMGDGHDGPTNCNLNQEMNSHFIQENYDFYIDEQLDLGDPWGSYFQRNPSWRLLPNDSSAERILPRPWTHQIHIGCLGQSWKPQISPIKSATDQICGKMLMSKALHPAGSGGYPPIQASPRNPQLDTPDRPDACLKMSIQDETIVKLWLLKAVATVIYFEYLWILSHDMNFLWRCIHLGQVLIVCGGRLLQLGLNCIPRCQPATTEVINQSFTRDKAKTKPLKHRQSTLW